MLIIVKLSILNFNFFKLMIYNIPHIIKALFLVFMLKYSFKKSLKTPKWQSESVYRRRTDNTIAKRKRTDN